MIYLNAGNLWSQEYLDRVIELNKAHDGIKVQSLFGSISKLTPTARAMDRIPYLEWGQIDKLVDKARSNDIDIRYTINASCLGSIQDFKQIWDAKLKADIQELHAIGVHDWTVTSPLLVELLKDLSPTDLIEVSTIAELSTIEDAKRWKLLGANMVNVSTSINRDFKRLREINKILLVSVLANEACLYRCPWRRECYNMSSHDSQRSEELFGYYPFRRCNEVRLSNPVEWIRSRMVLPQWMKEYQLRSGVNWFKVAYRTHPIEVALPILEAYMNQDYDGNLCDLWPPISRLGNTPEPREVTHIPARKIEASIVNWSIRDTCEHKICDVDCRLCRDVYENSQR